MTEMLEAYDEAFESDALESIEDFNAKYEINTGTTKFYMNGGSQLVMEVDPDFNVELMEVLSDEVPTFVGFGISLYGIFVAVKLRLDGIAKKIDRIVDKYK